MTKQFLAVQPDATYEWVPGTYEGIKAGMRGATIDFRRHEMLGCFLDDNSLLEGEQALNVVAGVMMRLALFGPVVFVAPEPNVVGDSMPCDPETYAAIINLCHIWQCVIDSAARSGQDLTVLPNFETVPPPKFIALPDDWNFGDPIPWDEA